MYLLDASALITAHNGYLAINRVPEYWDWLLHHGQQGSIKLPKEIYEEVEDGHDALAAWMKEAATKEALLSEENANLAHVQLVLGHYGGNLTDADLVTIGKDPFLIAAGYSDIPNRTVVTAEVSKPGRTGPRRHIPNVCNDCGVTWITPVQLLAALDFTTGWNA